jgi:glutaredoxin
MKIFACLLILLGATTLPAQTLYKWVDAQGKISYSDQPPPPNQSLKDLSHTVNLLGAGEAQAETLSFETQQLAKRSPVLIYTSKGCGPCDQGRQLLKAKNIPFAEKTVDNNNDLKALAAQFNSQSLPVLTVGTHNINGFGATQWNDALSAAGYNESSALPKTYVNGAASPLTPIAPLTPKPKAVAEETLTPLQLRGRVVTPNTTGTEPAIKF